MQADYLIVGSGLTGAVIARLLCDAGRDVLVLDRRPHLGGNVHDYRHESGVRIHTYGPHYFRTNSQELWDFVTRFAAFDPYVACIQSFVDNQFEQWPISGNYIRRAIGESWTPGFTGTPRNFEEASLSMMPRLVYEKFVKGYSEKQWGCPATELSADLARRFDVREDGDPRLFRHKHQGIPHGGYALFMQRLLAGIPLKLETDYLRERDAFKHRKKLVFTGPIDEFFGFDDGRLVYRGQQRRHQYLPDVPRHQPCGQVNYPDPAAGPHIRRLEWKHMLPADEAAACQGTVLTDEITITPTDPNHFEYPFPDQHNAALYQRYRQRAEALTDVQICGRLGEYRYYDMDQAIARAMLLARQIMDE